MIEVTSPSSEQRDWAAELTAFCVEHPVPGIDERLARWIMERLTRGPSRVLEVWGDSGRQAVAAVVDTCATVDHSADLALLGQVEGGLDEAAVAALIDRAEDVVRAGPRALLDVSILPHKASWVPVLQARGYVEAYALFAMERDAGAPCPAPRAALPASWAWQPVGDDALADYHRVVTAAFAEVPGAFVPPLEEMAERLAGSPRRPSVLVADGRVAAFCQVQLHDESGRRMGEVRSLGRDPAYRGRGLGDHLICRGITELAERGAQKMELQVAAQNTAALQLYERHGFGVVERRAVLRRRVGLRLRDGVRLSGFASKT